MTIRIVNHGPFVDGLQFSVLTEEFELIGRCSTRSQADALCEAYAKEYGVRQYITSYTSEEVQR